MRLHERYFKVNEAELRMREAIAKIAGEHDLTTAEMVRFHAQQAASLTKYLIRDERHPDDPEKKGDEADD